MILSLQSEYSDNSASPGSCYFCRAAKRPGEVVVDYHMQVDVATFDGTAIDGWLQSCSTCVTEMGRLIGMESADKVELLRDELALERERRMTAEDEADRAMSALDALREAPVRAPRRIVEDDE